MEIRSGWRRCVIGSNGIAKVRLAGRSAGAIAAPTRRITIFYTKILVSCLPACRRRRCMANLMHCARFRHPGRAFCSASCPNPIGTAYAKKACLKRFSNAMPAARRIGTPVAPVHCDVPSIKE
jgi:hypothetical protein